MQIVFLLSEKKREIDRNRGIEITQIGYYAHLPRSVFTPNGLKGGY